MPVVAPTGTVATILVELQLVIAVTGVPLKEIVLLPCVAPKFVPVMVTDAPTAPETWLRLAMAGATMNAVTLLATPETVTVIFPVRAPAGTAATILVALQLVIDVAAIPPKVTVLAPCVAPKFVPVMVMDAPTAPEGWLIAVTMAGTTKAATLLGTPDTVTMMGPVVAPAGTVVTIIVLLQLVGVAAVPLKVTVLVPCVAPKLLPVSVTGEPTAPEL